MRLPAIPVLRCTRCGDVTFIPLTFPRRKGADEVDMRARPTAKCITCGWSYVPLQRDGLRPRASCARSSADANPDVAVVGEPPDQALP